LRTFETVTKKYYAKLQIVGALLQTLADSPAIHNNEYKRADTVVNSRQHSSNDFTDFTMWLNKDGKIGQVILIKVYIKNTKEQT
jgi:hypothetical protein